jgi:hypothetical protein
MKYLNAAVLGPNHPNTEFGPLQWNAELPLASGRLMK